jgi:hypothetical protein
MRELPNPTFALSPVSRPRGFFHQFVERLRGKTRFVAVKAVRGALVPLRGK